MCSAAYVVTSFMTDAGLTLASARWAKRGLVATVAVAVLARALAAGTMGLPESDTFTATGAGVTAKVGVAGKACTKTLTALCGTPARASAAATSGGKAHAVPAVSAATQPSQGKMQAASALRQVRAAPRRFIKLIARLSPRYAVNICR